MVRRVLSTGLLQLTQQLFLPFREMNRCFDHHVTQQVTVSIAANSLDAFATQTKGLSGLSLRRNTNLRYAVKGRDIDFSTESGGCKTDGHLTVQIILFALKNRMRLEVNLDIKVSRRAAVDAVLAFAREPNAIALIDAGGNLDRQRLVLLDPPSPVTSSARIGNVTSGAVTLWAGLLDREETLLQTYLTATLAGRAGLRLRTGFGATPMAGVANLHRWDANLGFGAEGRLF